MTTKLYCVHLHLDPDKFAVEATSPRAAEEEIIARERGGSYEGISSVEVMPQCPCWTDNDVTEKSCVNCGAPL